MFYAICQKHAKMIDSRMASRQIVNLTALLIRTFVRTFKPLTARPCMMAPAINNSQQLDRLFLLAHLREIHPLILPIIPMTSDYSKIMSVATLYFRIILKKIGDLLFSKLHQYNQNRKGMHANSTAYSNCSKLFSTSCTQCRYQCYIHMCVPQHLQLFTHNW